MASILTEAVIIVHSRKEIEMRNVDSEQQNHSE